MGTKEFDGCLRRTFYPVGQGAFYREKFGIGDCFFNVVYDCGSSTNDKVVIEKRINSAFCDDEIIDVLFISHFHADHINGIEYLLKQCVVKKIFLPLVDLKAKELLLILCLLDGYDKSNFVYQFIENPSGTVNAIVQNKTNGTTPSNQSNMLPDIVEISETPEYGEMPLDRAKGIVGAGKKITAANLAMKWVYIPFNLKAKYRYNKLRKIIADRCSKVEFSKIIENWDDYKQILQDIYTSIPGDLNTSSLVVYSGPEKSAHKLKKDDNTEEIKGKIGCLFLGDYNLKSRQGWNAFEREYKDYFDNTLVLQIPHHGSKNNFNDKVLQQQIPCFVISAGKNNKYGHPDGCVIDKLKKTVQDKCLWVNEDLDTCFDCLINLLDYCVLFSSFRGECVLCGAS